MVTVNGMTDRQGFHAGWNHRLCEIPAAPSQGNNIPGTQSSIKSSFSI